VGGREQERRTARRDAKEDAVTVGKWIGCRDWRWTAIDHLPGSAKDLRAYRGVESVLKNWLQTVVVNANVVENRYLANKRG
jgi:hypothetical protein